MLSMARLQTVAYQPTNTMKKGNTGTRKIFNDISEIYSNIPEVNQVRLVDLIPESDFLILISGYKRF